jgi:hypothetical protein
MLANNRHEGCEFKTSVENEASINLLRLIGNDLSILDIGISDIDLVRYQNGS